MNLASLLASGGQSLNVPLVLLLIKATTILLAARRTWFRRPWTSRRSCLTHGEFRCRC